MLQQCSTLPQIQQQFIALWSLWVFWSLLACERSLMNIPDDTLPRRCLNTHSQSQRIFSSLPNEEYPKKFSHSCELYAQYTTMWKIQPSNNKYLTKSKDNKIRNERDRKKTESKTLLDWIIPNEKNSLSHIHCLFLIVPQRRAIHFHRFS